jgi:hypothetical protein
MKFTVLHAVPLQANIHPARSDLGSSVVGTGLLLHNGIFNWITACGLRRRRGCYKDLRLKIG